MSDDSTNGYFNPRYKAQSTSQLLSPDSISGDSISSTLSTSSLAISNNSKSHISAFFKMSLPHRKTTTTLPAEDRFIMTIMRSPSPHSQCASFNSSNDIPTTPLSTTSITMTDDSSNNGKIFKSKVAAAFNHVKYRWAVRMRPNFRTNESPIYFLGKMYNGKEETTSDDLPPTFNEQSYASFLTSFSQRIYFSYRKQFEPLNGLRPNGDLITSDCGWGCMIRCAQMLLAQTLVNHMTNTINLPYSHIQMSEKCPKRNSIVYCRNVNRTNRRTHIYTDIIRLFGDYPNVKCPFGIHKIVELGATLGIRPGEFFGPVSAAHCLKQALQAAVELNQIPDTLRIYTSQDAIIYREDVMNLCTAPSNLIKQKLNRSIDAITNNSSTMWLTSLLILVPLRLGLNELDLIYVPYLKEALKLTQTVGIIGGSPRHAVYILGFQDESFIDLDPHFSQTTVNVLEDGFDLSSYSWSSPKKLTAKKMDPSCTLGFYCRDKEDFEMFCAQWNHICHMKIDDRRACPIFRIERGTFQESNTRIFKFDYPSLNEEESVILRVTKLSLPESNSALLSTNNHQSHKSKSSSKIQYSDSYNDAGQVLNETKTKTNRARKHSLSDDYVFL
ncbi:unnamed protein product [Rotaria socialis]|uniref:Cysteine protease n=1 Tax=Rotaria socialis TaxID=392032 RepID=A0A817U7M0_9BILA|nr:unnamed protein product [Rotaria socialis]CAF4664666.1 unnamed protein product [Rotaria socialis]